jgi:hypothetical protein
VGALLPVLDVAVIAAFNAPHCLPIPGESPGPPNLNSGARDITSTFLSYPVTLEGPEERANHLPHAMRQLSGGWNSATCPLLIGREDMNHTMRATSQDEFGGPEVLKCLGDPRLVSPRVPNPRERSACGAHGPRVGRTVGSRPGLSPRARRSLGGSMPHAQGSAGPMQKVEGFESLQPLPGTEYLNV